jgi:hypothetical protein
MSLTPQDRLWFDKRDNLDPADKRLVEDVMDDIVTAIETDNNLFRDAPTPIMGDDRMAQLEAAVIRYILTCREG